MMPPTRPAQFTPSAITTHPGRGGRGPARGPGRQHADPGLPGRRPPGRPRPHRARRQRAPCRPRAAVVRHRAAFPGRDGDDRRGGARTAPVGGHRPAPAVEPGARAGQRAAGRDRQRALAAPGQPGQPDAPKLPGRAGGPRSRRRRSRSAPGSCTGPCSARSRAWKAASGCRPACSASRTPRYLAGAVAAMESSAWRGDPAQARRAAGLGVRVPGRPGTAGPHHRQRPGHPDRQVRPGAGLHQQPAGPAGHRAAAGPGPAGPDDRPPQVTTVTIGRHQQRTVALGCGPRWRAPRC